MEPETFLPLQEPTFFILLALRAGERHGYAILKDVQELSSGRIKLSTGTLYGAINRLLDQGFIQRVDPDEPSDLRRKKQYRITQRGLAVFEAEMARMRKLLIAAQSASEGRLQP
jgi:DNA-binding PadR family transcriptional regulator